MLDATDIAPTVTWGTSPEDVVAITGAVPDPDSFADPPQAAPRGQSLDYMGLERRHADAGRRRSSISSSAAAPTAASRISRAAAEVLRKGRKVASGIKQALVVPGSGLVKRQAEAEGLDRIFIEAGFEWREPGCSMCLAMNPDKVPPGERCASTSNRNFVGRQGPGARTHLLSPGHGGGGGGDRPTDRRSRAGRRRIGARGRHVHPRRRPRLPARLATTSTPT